ncbi:MAG: histidinol-phosphate aminotransferase family protein [Clostridia bacterium]|nr:histidinol-phosphate aminotransferase family protein [Clostridia bacterium]
MFKLSKKSESFTPYEPLSGNFKIRLDANESFIVPSKRLEGKILRAVKEVSLNRYPDPMATELCRSFAAAYGVDEGEVAASNGSDEMISVLYNAFMDEGDKIMVTEPDFSMYRFYASLGGFEVISLKKKELKPSVKAIIKMITEEKPRIFIFSNPCNPTGYGIKRDDVLKIARAAGEAGTLVVADEAYMEFWNQSVIPYINDFDNLLVMKTCSKALGSASLRVGFSVAPKRLTDVIKMVKPPYNVNSFSQVAAKVILDEKDYVKRVSRQIVLRKKELYRGLKALEREDFKVLPSSSNFVVVLSDRANDIFKALIERGIAIRCFNGFLRITAGSKSENAEVISAIADILS